MITEEVLLLVRDVALGEELDEVSALVRRPLIVLDLRAELVAMVGAPRIDPPRSKEKVCPPSGQASVSFLAQASESVFAKAPQIRIVPSR
ncbi:hypothetical protein [Streptomyces sp. NPDC002491]